MPAKELKLSPEKSRYVLKERPTTAMTVGSRLALFSLSTLLLGLLFAVPLYHLLRLAASDELYSEIPLIPLMSGYLIWLRRGRMPSRFEPAQFQAVLFSLAGLAALAFWWLPSRQIFAPVENYLAINILAFLLLFTAVTFFFLGKAFVRTYACPISLLAFMIPFPTIFREWIDTVLQHGSAVFAGWFFNITGAPVIRDGLSFHLPNIILHVAPECSGIHSTLVLTIVSVAGAWLFLGSPWKRTVLVLAVIPLALIRNGFRIFVLGRLCIAYGPHMLDTAIHHHGGPLFFALSLVPFFLLLVFLRRTEGANRKPSTA